jgi:hypothetical protein
MRSILSVLCVLLVVGCGDDDSSDSKADAGDHDDEHGSDHDKPAMLREVQCTDTSVSTLMLFDEPATGKIREEGKGDDFTTFVDATGGGMNVTQSYVYAKFSETGLQKLDLTDEEAFESLDWEIAFRRYVIRLNSGVSGPGEVQAGRTAPMTQFAELKKVPDALELRTEEYFTGDSCEFVSDGSGIGAPATALASYWTYKMCLQMTKNVYVIALPKKRHVKLEVLSYYSPENQKLCDETGEIGIPSGAGNIRVRWAFLD